MIRGPAGDRAGGGGRARGHVAAVAAVVLADPTVHADAEYDLTGPDALTLAEAAALIAEVDGPPDALPRRDPRGGVRLASSVTARPTRQVDAWVSTYTAIAAGEVATVSDAVPRITGRPATSLRDLLASAVTGDASPG